MIGALVKAVKGVKSAYFALKKPIPRSVVKVAKAAGAAGATVGTYAAADLIAQKLSGAITNPNVAGGLPMLANLAGQGVSALQRPGTSIQSVMPDVLDPSLLKTYYRAPKGYVIVRDPSTGNVMAVRKAVAKAYKLWRPARKPPISAGDWHRYQTAKSVEKKLLKIAGPALRKRQSRSAAGGRARKGK